MTDQELIQLLQEKPPGEFTPEEFAALRTRWTQSAEVRQALIEHLHLESQLTGAFGQVDLDIDKILKRAAEERRRSPSGRSPLWRWSAVLMLFLIVGIGSLFWLNKKPVQREIADGQPGHPTQIPDANPAIQQDGPAEPADALVAMETGSPATATPTQPPENPSPTKTEPLQPDANEPWSKTLSRDVAPWPANSDKFTRDFKASGHDELSEVEAKRWFTSVAGQPLNWGQDVYGQQQRRVARFHGFGRLRSPWPDDALLRMTPFEATDLTIYLWRGPTGIALRFYTRRDPHTWAAFEVVRENSSPKPIRWGLLTTDNGAYVRAGTGTFDLRYQDGGITLAKGGVPLLTAPLSGRPDEVFVEGQFRLRGISIHRTAPLPTVSDNPHPLVVGGPPASQPWAASVEAPAEMTGARDGAAEFRVDSRDKPGMAVLPLARRGLYEVIAKVDSADPGTGIFLGDLDGRPIHRLGFFRDAATGRTTIGVLRPGEVRDQANFDFNSFPTPYHTSAQWIKIIAGLGTVQVLVSGDGRQWGHLIEDPARDLPGAVGSVGLFGFQGPQARVLKLASLEVRSLSGITSLGDPRLVALAPQFTAEDWKDPVRWSHRTVDTTPPGVDLQQWIAACSISSLTQGPPREFAVNAVKHLLSTAIPSNMATLQKLQLLDDVSLVCDMWEESSARVVADHYDAIANQLAAAGGLHPVATIRAAVLRSPMWTNSKLRFAWDKQVSQDLVRTVYRTDWPDAMRTGQSTLFWNASVHPDWVPVERAEVVARQARWVKSIAVENAPQLDDGQAGIIPGSWRHPLALQWNKEAYNVRAELQAALTGQTYEDACRVVMSINVSDGPGLLPDMDDRQLFVSLPTAVASAMQAHPEFARLMTDKFGPLGVIRVRQAVQSGDVRGVQSATLQFFGTEAAAEAHQWLGDRDLSAGRFPSAEEHFLLGLAHCLPRQREGLQSRLQLATALNGKPAADPAVASVNSIELSGAKISAAELEALVKSLAARPSAATRFQHPAIAAAPALNPLAYRVEQRATFDGQPGLSPDRYEFRFGDPFGKQLAVISDSQRIYVSNRFQVNAYALPGGQQQWAQGLGSEQGEAHGMPFTPMTPLVAGDRLFVRRLAKGGTELACLNAENGNVVWAQRPGLQVLSDPVFWNGSLFALTLAKVDDDLVQVEGTRFDIESGAATSSQPLFRLRESSDRSNAAQLTVSGRLAVCSMAGISACFDGSGEIHWLRRHLWLPKQIDDLADDFRVAPPLVQGNRVVMSVPGVRTVTCMDLETGRQIWTRSLSDLRGVIAMQDSKVLVDTVALTALSGQDGQVVWSRPLDSRLEAFQVNDQFVVASQRIPVGSNKTQSSLVWLKLDNGTDVAQSELFGFERPECQIGPIIYAGSKWWSLGGQGWKETKRELFELATASPLIPGPVASGANSWMADIPASQLIDLALVLPGWRPEVNYGTRLQLTPGDVRGEQYVITAKLDQHKDVRLLQLIDIPKDRKTSLKLRFGNAADRRWALTVRVGDKQVFEQVVEESGSSNGWREAIVDLTPFAGKQVPVQLIQTLPPQQQPTESLWKQAVILVE